MCLSVPAKVESISESSIEKTGKVSIGGVVKEVSLSLIESVAVGDYVLVHAGFAISTIDEDKAQEVFQLLSKMQEQDSSS
jgi:hydrogenase expression/formation protein HypC